MNFEREIMFNRYLFMCLNIVLTVVFVGIILTNREAQGVTRLGKSCQVCKKSATVEVCKYYKNCPVSEERR